MIPIAKPCFGPEELEAIRGPLDSGWIAQGPRVLELEQRIGAYVGVSHAAACSSGTTALHLAVSALKAGPGDEVVVPAFTWVSTPNAVELAGARPVFCDIELDDFAASASQMSAAAGPRTVGFLPVHLFGLCAAIDAIAQEASGRGLWVVEDAACALGATFQGRHAGSFGAAGCFSFHPRKSITMGEGGMVTTSDVSLDARVRKLRNLGMSRGAWVQENVPGEPDFDEMGFNYRLTDLQAAIGVVQMTRLESILEAKRRLASRYSRMLGGLEGLRLPKTPAGRSHAWQSYVCLVGETGPSSDSPPDAKAKRDAIIRRLAATGVAARPGTHAPVLLPYYARKYGLRPEDFPNAVLADRTSLALPLYPQMTEQEQERVVEALAVALRS